MQIRPEPLTIDPANPFANDALDRRELVDFMDNLVTKVKGPMVLAIDSPWGTGKTTLVNMFKAHLEAKGFKCIYFNAWASDYATDPLVAMVAKIDLKVEKENEAAQKHLKRLKRITTLVAKRGAIAAVKAATFGALELDKEFEAALAQGTGDATSDLVDLMLKESDCLAKFREELQATVESLKEENDSKNLVFFIDELDRCRPNFAIELLERVKHLFDVPNVIFVLSIDKQQLEVSTSAIYGSGIDAREYLRRFIDLELRVPQASSKAFTRHLLARFDLDKVFSTRIGELQSDSSTFVDIFSLIASATKMSLRTQEHCVSRLALVLDQTPTNHYLFPVLVGTLVATRALNPKLFSDIRSASASTAELMDWLRSLDSSEMLKNSRLACAIESYMNVADPNDHRRSTRMKELEEKCNNTELDGNARTYARDVLAFSLRLSSSFSGAPQLAYVMRKIDFADGVVR